MARGKVNDNDFSFANDAKTGKRDIGALMGVSPGKVSKLLGQYRSERQN